jgi:hypothetical protein|tara:strand:- start:401 stop:610 length:210 start_codon:yes stop_codon:yes gene_type:complete
MIMAKEDKFVMPDIEFDENTINSLSGIEKMNFIEYVLDDYEYILEHKTHPKLLTYYKDVLSRLIKKHGH